MKLSMTIAVAGLLFAPALLNADCWYCGFEGYPGYGLCDAKAGSALCYGLEYVPTSPPTLVNCVWLLHGSCPQDPNHFQRFSTTSRTWTQRANLPYSNPREYVGWGGALAHGPTPSTVDSGRVFAFTGNNTCLFWGYSPPSNQWFSRPSVPWPVGAGGALCYGGVQNLDGTLSAVFYALVGGGYPYFYRYSYPMQGASDGSWVGRANFYQGYGVYAGGALAWVPRTDSPAVYPMGQVFALRGQGSYHLYSYNPATNAWRLECTLPYEMLVGSGAAMSPGPDRDDPLPYEDIRFFVGGHARAYVVWNPAGGTSKLTLSQPTPCQQNAGAALCEAEATHACYAVFGESTRDTFAYHDGFDPPEEEGGQSRVSAGPQGLPVEVRAGPGEHRFIVSCAAGPVALKVVDALGRVAVKASAEASSAGAELTWRHGSARAGVYFYTIGTQAGSGSGKLAVAR